MVKHHSKLTIIFFAFILTACGGGGGGGGGSDNTVTPTAVLADEDPLQVTQEVFGASSFADAFVLGFALGLTGASAVSVSAASESTTEAAGSIASLAGRMLEDLRSADATTDDVVTVSPSVIRACDESGSVNIIETEDRLELDFMDCDGGLASEELDFPGIVNGAMVLEITGVDNTGSVVGANFRFNLVDFTTVDDEDSLYLDGNFRGAVAFPLDESYFDIDLFTSEFSIQLNDDVSQLTNYEIDARVTDNWSRQDGSGGLEGFGFEGLVYFYTQTPLRFTYSADQFTSGVLIIEGVDDGRITITANGTEFPDVDIDYDGDGVVDEQPTWSWTEIFALEADI